MVADTEIPSENQPEKTPDSILGIDRKIRVPILPEGERRIIESSVEFRYRIQGLAREILGDKDRRLQYCLRRTAPGAAYVEVRRDPDAGTSHFRNLELCSRVWTCPVCSARIANQRREELSNALAAAKLKGLHPVLVTYTLRHDWRDKLDPLLQGLLDALRLFKSGRAYQDIKEEYGIVGGIRALEMTYTENGWHPHVHELLFLDVHLSPAHAGGLRKWLADRWVGCLRKLDFDASFAHGVDVRNADSKIAEYIAKFGREPAEKEWGIEHEIASAASKKATLGGLTPFQLLESYDIGDKRAEGLFLEYAEAMSGKRQLVWSAGLRALLALPEEVKDEQLPLLEEAAPTVYTAVQIDQKNWSRVLLFDLRGAILWLVAAGDWSTLQALLRKYVIEAQIFMNPPAEIMDKVLPRLPAAGDHDNSLSTQETLFPLPPRKVRYE